MSAGDPIDSVKLEDWHDDGDNEADQSPAHHRQSSRNRRKSTTRSCGSLLGGTSNEPLTSCRERSVPNVHFYIPAEHPQSAEPRVNLNLSIGSMDTGQTTQRSFSHSASPSLTIGTPKDLEEVASGESVKPQGFTASLWFMLSKWSNWRQCHKAPTTHSVGPTPDRAPSQSTSSRILRAFSFVGKMRKWVGMDKYAFGLYELCIK